MLTKYISILVALSLSRNSIAYIVIARKLLNIILTPLDLLLSFIEQAIIKEKRLPRPKLVFIVGGHRTGATFLSQVIGNNSGLRTLNNFNSIFPKSSFIIFKLISDIYRSYYSSKIKNFYGQTWGLFEISDVHEVWYKWYGSDHDVVPKFLTVRNKQSIFRYFSCLTSCYKKPIVIKNGRNSLMISQLFEIFPDAFFIAVDRNIEDVALSTLHANKFFRRKSDVWGLKVSHNPKNQNLLPEIDAIVQNLIILNEEISAQLASIPDKNLYRINYSKFCQTPNQHLDELYKLLGTHFDVSLTNEHKIKEAMPVKKNKFGQDYQDVKEALSRFQ